MRAVSRPSMGYGVALTRRGSFAVYSCRKAGNEGALEVFDSLGEAEEAGHPSDILERAKAELTGISWVEELGI